MQKPHYYQVLDLARQETDLKQNQSFEPIALGRPAALILMSCIGLMIFFWLIFIFPFQKFFGRRNP